EELDDVRRFVRNARDLARVSFTDNINTKLIAGLLSCSSWTPSTGPVSTAHSSTVIASRASSTSARLTTSD
ncbi:unnamed protein product, partial [Ascophyllum nodosum]